MGCLINYLPPAIRHPANSAMRAQLASVICITGLATASAAERPIVPTSIVDMGPYAALAPVLQAIFWTPDLRERVLKAGHCETPGHALLAASQLFMDMQEGDGHPVSAGRTLLRAMTFLHNQGRMVAHSADIDMFETFFGHLMNELFKAPSEHVLSLLVEEHKLLYLPGRSDVALRTPRSQPDASLFQRVRLNGTVRTPVHQLIVQDSIEHPHFSSADMAMTVRSEDILGMNDKSLGLPRNCTLAQALDHLGLSGTTSLSAYVQRRINGPLPRILVISASNSGHNSGSASANSGSADNALFKHNIEVFEHDYGSKFTFPPHAIEIPVPQSIAQKTSANALHGRRVNYSLHAIVFRAPDNHAFSAAVCTNPETNEWYFFEDTTVVRLRGQPQQDASTGIVQMLDMNGRSVTADVPLQPRVFFYAGNQIRDLWAKTKATQRKFDHGVWSSALKKLLAKKGDILTATKLLHSVSERLSPTPADAGMHTGLNSNSAATTVSMPKPPSATDPNTLQSVIIKPSLKRKNLPSSLSATTGSYTQPSGISDIFDAEVQRNLKYLTRAMASQRKLDADINIDPKKADLAASKSAADHTAFDSDLMNQAMKTQFRTKGKNMDAINDLYSHISSLLDKNLVQPEAGPAQAKKTVGFKRAYVHEYEVEDDDSSNMFIRLNIPQRPTDCSIQPTPPSDHRAVLSRPSTATTTTASIGHGLTVHPANTLATTNTVLQSDLSQYRSLPGEQDKKRRRTDNSGLFNTSNDMQRGHTSNASHAVTLPSSSTFTGPTSSSQNSGVLALRAFQPVARTTVTTQTNAPEGKPSGATSSTQRSSASSQQMNLATIYRTDDDLFDVSRAHSTKSKKSKKSKKHSRHGSHKRRHRSSSSSESSSSSSSH